MLVIVRNIRMSMKVAVFSAVLGMACLSGCTRSTAPAATTRTAAVQQQAAIEAARQQLELIPPPSKTRYMAVRSLSVWENPYITVQDGMLTIHVVTGDSNPSQIGAGGMLRPIGARRQDLNVRPTELIAALNAIPENSWPYGRVVAVEEAHEVPASEKPAMRRNVESVMKTLNDLGVVVYEWNEGQAR